MAIDQLRYTWARQGLEGVSRFQVVAVSQGFADPSSRERAWARELCTYPGTPGGEQARDWASVGWIPMRDGRRVVFHRVDSGLDGAGRRGNFAAHVLLGPEGELSADDAPAIFGSAMWWTGDDVEQPRLEPFVVSVQSPAVLGDSTGVVDALALLLASGGEIAGFARTPRAAGKALTVVCDVAPHLLTSRSVSTFERSDAASSFQVVGTVTGQALPEVPNAAARAVAEYLIGLSASDRRKLRRSCCRDVTWASLVPTLWPFAVRATGRPLNWEDIAEASKRVDVAIELCEYPEGRQALCNGLERGTAAALELLTRLLTEGSTELARQVSADATATATQSGRHDIMTAVDRAGGAALEGAADAVERFAASENGRHCTALLPLGVLGALLSRRPVESTVPLRSDWAARAATLVPHSATVRALGTGWGEVVPALGERGDWESIARVVADSEEAASAAARRLSLEDWLEVVTHGRAAVPDGVLAAALRAGLPPETRRPLFWAWVRRNGPDAGWRFLRDTGIALPPPVPQDERAALAFVRRRAQAEVEDANSRLDLLDAAKELSRSSELLALWGRMAAAKPAEREGQASVWSAVQAPGLHMEARWAVMTRILRHRAPQSLMHWSADTLLRSGSDAGASVRCLTTTAYRCHWAARRAGVAAAILVVARLVEQRHVAVSRRTARLKGDIVDDALLRVADAVGLGRSEVIMSVDHTFSAPALDWLHAMLRDDRESRRRVLRNPFG